VASTWKGSSKRRRRPTGAATAQTVKDTAGRVHLIVQGSSAGRVVAGLSAPLFAEPWQDTLALTTANAVVRHLGETPTASNVAALTTEAMNALSKLTEGLAAQSERPIACSAGCAHCCHQSVGVTGVEALTIAHHLKATWGQAELDGLRERTRAMRARTQGMTYKERHAPSLPCVFLGDAGKCTIYAVRPLVCRAVNSLNADECRENLHDESKRTAYLESGHGASALLGPVRASHAMSAGLQLAGADVYQLDMRPLDLIAVMDLLLDDEAAQSRWLAGEPAFEAASGSDATSNVQLRNIAGLDRHHER
jgi:Fe-S-cluster containining protein